MDIGIIRKHLRRPEIQEIIIADVMKALDGVPGRLGLVTKVVNAIANPPRVILEAGLLEKIKQRYKDNDWLYNLVDDLIDVPEITYKWDSGEFVDGKWKDVEVEETEELDFENLDKISLDDRRLVIQAGGDWQPPHRLTIGWSVNEDAPVVVQYEPTEWVDVEEE